MADNETIAAIIAEMRKLGKLDEKSIDEVPRTLLGLGLRTYADRIEAEHKRELSEVAGLATKYRTALARINALATYCRQPNVREQIIEQCENIFAEERNSKTKETEAANGK